LDLKVFDFRYEILALEGLTLTGEAEPDECWSSVGSSGEAEWLWLAALAASSWKPLLSDWALLVRERAASAGGEAGAAAAVEGSSSSDTLFWRLRLPRRAANEPSATDFMRSPSVSESVRDSCSCSHDSSMDEKVLNAGFWPAGGDGTQESDSQELKLEVETILKINKVRVFFN